MAHKQLDYLKRCRISALWDAGYKQVDIAKAVGVHPSTISRELKRNIVYVRSAWGFWAYKPNYAQFNADENHRTKKKHIKLTESVKTFIKEKLLEQWSPDQISGYAKRHELFSIGKEWIYQFILKDKQNGGKLYMNLRHQHKKYRKRYGSPKRQGAIKNRRFIDDRPAVVDAKQRIGDWEIDTIIGGNRKQAIVSIVERKSKKTVLKKVIRKTAENVSIATIESLSKLSLPVLTITADNGSEFAYHGFLDIYGRNVTYSLP